MAAPSLLYHNAQASLIQRSCLNVLPSLRCGFQMIATKTSSARQFQTLDRQPSRSCPLSIIVKPSSLAKALPRRCGSNSPSKKVRCVLQQQGPARRQKQVPANNPRCQAPICWSVDCVAQSLVPAQLVPGCLQAQHQLSCELFLVQLLLSPKQADWAGQSQPPPLVLQFGGRRLLKVAFVRVVGRGSLPITVNCCVASPA
jgi:hypothetical protein